MSEQAKEVLSQLMQRALDGVDSAVEFSQQQIPEIIEQLLMWNAIESLIYFVSGAVFVALSPYAFVAGARFQAKADADYEAGKKWTRYSGLSSISSVAYDSVGIAKWLSLFPAIIGLIMIFSNLTWLKIWLAPKLYLLEYGASLIK